MNLNHIRTKSFYLFLRLFLPILQPGVLRWANQLAYRVSIGGEPLDEAGLAIARKVGVRHPEKIRIGYVRELPLPDNFILRIAAVKTGMFNSRTVGFTLGYSVLIQEHCDSVRLRLHEFRHVHQYESAGEISSFLPIYLRQILKFGYWQAPFEIDARACEAYEDQVVSPAETIL